MKKLKEKSNKINEIINHNIIESLNEQQKISILSLLQNMENLSNKNWIGLNMILIHVVMTLSSLYIVM